MFIKRTKILPVLFFISLFMTSIKTGFSKDTDGLSAAGVVHDKYEKVLDEIIDDNHIEKLNGEALSKARSAKAKLLLRTWKEIRSAIDPKFDFNDLPMINMAPPGGNYDSGIAPEDIKEPDVRAAYEKALADNEKKADARSVQGELRNMDATFLRTGKAYLVAAYSRLPLNTDELKQYLDEYISDKDLKKSILDEVMKGIDEKQKK